MDLQQYKGLAGFRSALRKFVAASEVINRQAGTTQQQYQALLVIRTYDEGALSIGSFAGELLLTHHGAVQLVDRLARAGLAERARSMDDRRTVHVALTTRGASLLDELAERHLEELLRQEPLLTRSLKRVRGVGHRDHD